MADKENVELVEEDRPGIGLSPKDAKGESGPPNIEGGEQTHDAPVNPPREEPTEDS